MTKTQISTVILLGFFLISCRNTITFRSGRDVKYRTFMGDQITVRYCYYCDAHSGNDDFIEIDLIYANETTLDTVFVKAKHVSLHGYNQEELEIKKVKIDRSRYPERIIIKYKNHRGIVRRTKVKVIPDAD